MSKNSSPLRKAIARCIDRRCCTKAFQVVPRLLRNPEAAQTISAARTGVLKSWFEETNFHSNRGREYRVIDVRDLDNWIEQEKERQAAVQQAEAA